MAGYRDRASLLALLEENIGFLEASATSFDAGYEAEAKRLAVTMRVLLHDTTQSHSLLAMLGAKPLMKFTDTAEHINPNNIMASAAGLVMMQMTPTVGAAYIAPLGNLPLPPTRIHPPVDFDQWWGNDIARDTQRATWNRKKFVLTMANKEGGAHVDPKLTEAYEILAKNNGLGFVSNASGVDAALDGNVVAVSVRQIAHELLETLAVHASYFDQ